MASVVVVLLTVGYTVMTDSLSFPKFPLSISLEQSGFACLVFVHSSHLKPVNESLHWHCPVWRSQELELDPSVLQLHAMENKFYYYLRWIG